MSEDTNASASNAPDQKTNKSVCPVRAGAYVVGFVFVILVCLIVGYSELIASRGGSIEAILLGATHMPPGAVAGLIVILFGNSLIRRIAPQIRMNPAELIMIYFMMVCAALISSFGLAAQLLPNLVGINYFAAPQNNWRALFFRHIPKWLVPWDPAGPEKQFVSKAFYEGLRAGEKLPWANWIVPLAAWTILALLLFFLMACIATLVRRQWVDNERLSFPLVQLPVELANTENRPFLSSKVMWLGFLIPMSVHGINGLHNMFPSIPGIRVFYVLNSYFVTKPWSDLYFTPVVVAFSVVGFSFLLPLDVSFSFWFFLVFFRSQELIASMLGYVPGQAALYPATYTAGYQSAGAFSAIFVSMLLLARPHLRLVGRRVFGREKSAIDRDEFMGYRTAFWGMVGSFVLIIIWCALAGVTWWIAALMMFIFVFIILLVLSRCVSEVGLLMLQPIFRPIDIWAIGAPRAALGAANLSVLALINGIFYRDPRTLMPAFLDAMKASDYVGARRRNLAPGIAIAIIAAVISACVIHLSITYRLGGLRLNTWFFRNNPALYFGEAKNILEGGKPFDPKAALWFGLGAGGTFFLYIMRARFWWWPFHPLGYAMGAAWPCIVYWSAFFFGWLAKALVLRYFGAKGYAVARPFFLGLILGEFASGILWSILVATLGVAAPSIPIT